MRAINRSFGKTTHLLAGLAMLACPVPALAEMHVFIGTPDDAIYAAQFDEETGTLTLTGPAANIARPTWLELGNDQRTLFATSELGNWDMQNGQVSSYAINPATGALTLISQLDSGGNGPTHLAFSARHHALFVAHFGQGQVSILPVSEAGELSPPASVVHNFGNGPHQKQAGPHAHGVVPSPDGSVILVPDMGADRVFAWRYDPASRSLSPHHLPFAALPAGSGPRHAAFAPDGRHFYLLNELTAEVTSFGWDAAAGQLHLIGSSLLDPPGTPTISAAEIAVSADGRFVYASNRGRNLLHVFARDAASGVLSPEQEISSGGTRPRSFALVPGGRWMIVGNQDSQDIQIFAIDPATGQLQPHGDPLPFPAHPVAFALVQADDSAAEVLAVEDALAAAIPLRDEAALEALHCPDLRYVHANGMVDGREAFITRTIAPDGILRGMTIAERDVTLGDNIAVVTGTVMYDIGAARPARYTAAYRREGGQWCLFSWQNSPMPRPQ